MQTMANNKVFYVTFFAVINISVSYILNVQKAELGYEVIRQKHGIDYLQYIGLIPGNIKCNKWGYKKTNFDSFKLEIVCLQETKVHQGNCPIWQDCQWYIFYNYFPITCSQDSDCDSTCKCCYSPCFRTAICRPAIIRTITQNTSTVTTTTEGNTRPSTSASPTTIRPSSTTIAPITINTPSTVNSPNYDEKDIPIELDYNNDSSQKSPENVVPQTPSILPEGPKEDSNDSSDVQTDDQNFSRETSTEPSLIRPPAPPSSSLEHANTSTSKESSSNADVIFELDENTDKEIDLGSGESGNGKMFEYDDEDMGMEKEGSGSGF